MQEQTGLVSYPSSARTAFVCNMAVIITVPKERQKNPSVGFSVWQFVLQLLSRHTQGHHQYPAGRPCS